MENADEDSAIPCEALRRLIRRYSEIESNAAKTLDAKDRVAARMALNAVNGHIAEHGCWGPISDLDPAGAKRR